MIIATKEIFHYGMYQEYYLVLILLAILAVAVSPAYAQTDGNEVGQAQGIDDANEGKESDSTCPPNDSDYWCLQYKLGYADGYRIGSLDPN
jgi:hypothetical protein